MMVEREQTNGAPKKSPLLLLIIGLVAIAAVGLLVGVPWWEKDQAREIKELLADSPGKYTAESVEVSFWSKGVVISGLKGTLPYLGGKIDLVLDKLTAAGVSLSSFSKNEVLTLADTLTCSGFKGILSMDDPAGLLGNTPVRQNISFAHLEAKGLRGNVVALREAGMDSPEAIKKGLEAIKGFRIASISAKDYKTSMDAGFPLPMESTIESFTAENLSLLSSGPSIWSNFIMSLSGQELCRVESLRLKKFSVPDFFSPVLELQSATDISFEKREELAGEAILAKLVEEPFDIEGLSVSNATFRIPGQEAVTLKEYSLDAKCSPEAVVFQQSFGELLLPPSVYATLDSDAAMFAKQYGKPLVFSGSSRLSANQKDGKGTLDVEQLSLKEKELGSISFNVDLVFGARGGNSFKDLLEKGADWKIKKAKAVFEDKGMVEQAFTLIHTQQANALGEDNAAASGVAAIRAEVVAEIQKEAQRESNADKRALAEGFAKLLEQPGVLIIDANPEKPQAVEAAFAPVGMFNVSTSFVPAQ